MNENEQDPPQVAEGKEAEALALPTSGEGSASIVARMKIQRDLAANGGPPEAPEQSED